MLCDLGWKKVHCSTPVAWIMTGEVATLPAHAGSTYAELDELEQRIMQKFLAPRNCLIWKYVKINFDGSKQLCNLQPSKSESRFVAIDAKRQKLDEETKEIVDDDDGTPGPTKIVFVEAASGQGSPDITPVAGVSAMTPPMRTSECLADKPVVTWFACVR